MGLDSVKCPLPYGLQADAERILLQECAEPVPKTLGSDYPSHLTPTRVLRSGRRVAATPQVPASARRKASRVPAEEQTDEIDLQPRRVAVTEQVTALCT